VSFDGSRIHCYDQPASMCIEVNGPCSETGDLSTEDRLLLPLSLMTGRRYVGVDAK